MGHNNLEYRHECLMREVDLAIRALRKGHPLAAEHSLIILEVAKRSDTRLSEIE
jgi:hypothetical protein